jgi:hypothetical protein
MMGRVGATYGSERHFLTWRRAAATQLDARLLAVLGSDGDSIRWLYPDQSGSGGDEPRGVGFLKSERWATGTERALATWPDVWPQSGTPQSWDGIAILEHDGAPVRWLLFEAKANHPEMVRAPTRASKASLSKIQTALNATKHHLGVHRHFDWTGSYYQFANRLTMIRFLNQHDVPATLVELFFVNDVFPDNTPCPACEADWRPLIDARRLTLGLRPLTLEDGVVHVFLELPVLS